MTSAPIQNLYCTYPQKLEDKSDISNETELRTVSGSLVST